MQFDRIADILFRAACRISEPGAYSVIGSRSSEGAVVAWGDKRAAAWSVQCAIMREAGYASEAENAISFFQDTVMTSLRLSCDQRRAVARLQRAHELARSRA